MLGLKVSKADANRVKNHLLNLNLINLDYLLISESDSLIFPLSVQTSDQIDIKLKDDDYDYQIVNLEFEPKKRPIDFKDSVLKLIPVELHNKFNSAHDIVGTIAILEINYELIEYQKKIAELLLKSNNNIKTVVKKKGIHEGEFRLQSFEHLAGVDTKVATVRENGIVLELDIEKVYYSIRSSNERKRIIDLVKTGEKVLVLFAGAGPFTIAIAKNTDASLIVSCELNPYACEVSARAVELNHLTEKNLTARSKKRKLNFITHIDQHCGDVKKEIGQIESKYGKFDRIIMPLPHTATDFLLDALKVSSDTVIHLYDFGDEKSINDKKAKLIEQAESVGFEIEILDVIKCGQFSPNVYRLCFDIHAFKKK